MGTTATNEARQRLVKPRWWPALFFLGLSMVVVLWLQFFWDGQQQDKNLRSYMVAVVCVACLLLWLVLLSRLRPVIRWLGLGTVLVLPGLVLAVVRIKGVDGDLVPILEWRWRTAPAPLSEGATPPPAVASGGAGAPALDGWPQFLGPNRNSTVTGIRLQRDWVGHPPREVWRVPLGPAWSGFAISGGVAVTLEQDVGRERVSALDARTGGRLWAYSYEARYATTIAGEGPRSTPAISDGLVYASGATGWLTCLDLKTGERIWAHNVLGEEPGQVPEWGFSVSPLIAGDRVIMGAAGSHTGSLIAFDKRTGGTLWTAGVDAISYSSPILHELGGQVQIITFNEGSVAGHDVETGRLLWQHPYARGHVHVATPLPVGGDRILVSSGYGHGSELYHIQVDETARWSAELVWTSRRMKAKFCNLVEHDGFIYGLDDGIFACISMATGELQWKDGRYGHGQVILVNDLLLVSTETGDLVLVEPDAGGLRELGRVEVFSGKTWNPPALAGPYLFLRTDSEAVCLELSVVERE